MKYKALLATLVLSMVSMNASADIFPRAGTVLRIATDSEQFNGCMIKLSSNISNGCPDNGWVSLDCNSAGGKNKLATAFVAVSLNKPLAVQVDNTKKTAEGFCIAKQVNVVFE